VSPDQVALNAVLISIINAYFLDFHFNFIGIVKSGAESELLLPLIALSVNQFSQHTKIKSEISSSKEHQRRHLVALHKSELIIIHHDEIDWIGRKHATIIHSQKGKFVIQKSL